VKVPCEILMDYYMREVGAYDHPMKFLRPVFEKRGFLSALELRQKPQGRKVRVAGLLVMIHTPPTRSGRRVMFVTLEDETGLIDLAVFENVQRYWAREILSGGLLSFEGILQKEGKGGRSVSIVARRLVRNLSGPLECFMK